MREWWRCADPDCDVRWARDTGQPVEETCWACGGRGVQELTALPGITSQHSYARPLTDENWSRIRQEIGVD